MSGCRKHYAPHGAEMLKKSSIYKHCAPNGALKHLRVLHRGDEFRQRVFRVAVKHSRHWFKEKRILEAGKSFALSTFQNDHRFRAIDFQDWHAGNRTVWVVARVGINDVVGADDDRDIRGRKFRIN